MVSQHSADAFVGTVAHVEQTGLESYSSQTCFKDSRVSEQIGSGCRHAPARAATIAPNLTGRRYMTADSSSEMFSADEVQAFAQKIEAWAQELSPAEQAMLRTLVAHAGGVAEV